MSWHFQTNEKPVTPEQAREKLLEGTHDRLEGDGPGPVTSRLKPTKKSNHTYPLKLTQKQRESLLECTRIRGALKKKLEEAGEGTQIVSVTRKELEKINDESGQASAGASSMHKTRLLAVMVKVGKFLEDEQAEVFNFSNSEIEHTLKTSLLFQFKVTLLGTKPPIWRRIQVLNCSLNKLHEHIQTAMGWTNSHLHQFEINGEECGDPQLLSDEFEDFEGIDSTQTLISDILPKSANRFAFKYVYDFGDRWEHEVVFEGKPTVDPKVSYPVCIEGGRACPPEDCGGVWGYQDFLKAIRDTQHEDHENMLEWIGGRFDSEAFDPEQTTKAMKKSLPNWGHM